MQILIHACPARMWYVSEFLEPELRRQGLTDIRVWNDAERRGNVEACMAAFESCAYAGDTWHLQDDVWPSGDFAVRAEEAESFHGVVCGFVNEVAGPDANQTGIQNVKDLWWSFPCIRIPDPLARECAAWVRAGADHSDEAFIFKGQRRGDDWYFQRFLELERPETEVLHLGPCMVEHVDFLLGGSQINPWRGFFSRAAYWEDEAAIENLKKRIKARKAFL